MTVLLLPKDPTDFIHAAMLSRLDGIEIWDGGEGDLALAQPFDLTATDIRKTALRYRHTFGDFHRSFYNTSRKAFFEKHLFWALRHRSKNRAPIAYAVALDAFKRGIPAVLQKATAESAQFMQCYRQSLREWHRLLGFVRLRGWKENILCGYVETEFDVIDLLVDFLMRRYPGYSIVIQNYETLWYSHPRAAGDRPPMKRGKQRMDDNDLAKLFDAYYESQYIRERKNIRQLTHFIPRRYWSWIDNGAQLERYAVDGG
jgi:probable DNA metabolism protein